MFEKIHQLLEMIRFSHTLFALPFALCAAVMAWIDGLQADPPVSWSWRQLLGILLCMATARSCAMALNRILDREVDAKNPRTAIRHLPAGVLSLRSVWVFAIVSGVGFIASTALFLPNTWPLILSVPVLAFLIGYSWTKRFTALAHFWLGAALMMAPVAAWIAIRGSLDWPPVVLGVAVMLWVAGFDIIYACQDFEFDREAGLHSVPAKFGIVGALRIAAACHAGMLVALVALPWVFAPLGAIYYVGIGVVALLLIYEHWLVRPDDLSRVNAAFFNINVVISIGLFLLITTDLLT